MLDLKWHVSKSFKTTAFRFRSIVLPKILLTIDLRITNTRTSIHIIQKIRMKCVKKTIEHWILLTIAKLSNKKNVYSCSTNICFVCRIVELSNCRMVEWSTLAWSPLVVCQKHTPQYCSLELDHENRMLFLTLIRRGAYCHLRCQNSSNAGVCQYSWAPNDVIMRQQIRENR